MAALRGYKSRPGYNGQHVIVFDSAICEADGSWLTVVEVLSNGEMIQVKPSKTVLIAVPVGICVRVVDRLSVHNGQRAVILSDARSVSATMPKSTK